MFDNTMKGCTTMTSKPTGTKYAMAHKMMGEYKSKAEAETAMKSMKEC
jgi:hypothetical protein